MNCYATLDELKTLLALEDATHDASLLRLLNAASRQIEREELTGRRFYTWEGTKYFDGHSTPFWLPDDILSITTSQLKIDEDGDGTYEATLAITDYHLYPLNDFPKIRLEINTNGNYGGFAPGILKGIQIAGVFGYGDGLSATPYELRTTLSADLTSSATTAQLADSSTVKIGETIRCESEQIWVKDKSGTNVTIERAVNGTTGTTHASAKAVYAYLYPEDIVQATLILAMRAWKRKDSAFADIIGTPEIGQIIMSKGVDPDVLKIVQPYRKQCYV